MTRGDFKETAREIVEAIPWEDMPDISICSCSCHGKSAANEALLVEYIAAALEDAAAQATNAEFKRANAVCLKRTVDAVAGELALCVKDIEKAFENVSPHTVVDSMKKRAIAAIRVRGQL